MNLFTRIIFTIIATSIFLFLVFVTFVTNTMETFEKPYYTQLDTWTYELTKNSRDLFSLEKKWEINDDSILVEQIWLSNKIIYSTWSIDIENNNINLAPWLYFFDLRELDSDYTIKSEWFEVEKNWPWIFIVNTLNPKKNIVFSVSSLLDLKLKNFDNSEEEVSNLNLYPHSYLIFNPKKNIFVKNADLLKISQTFTLWYFNDKLYSSDIVNKDFLELITLKDEKYNKLTNYSLLSIRQDHERKGKLLNDFLINNFWIIPWENLANKYFDYFVNDSKKIIYYKNQSLRKLSDLIKAKQLLPSKINDLYNTVSTLKSISKTDAYEITDIINHYYRITILTDADLNTRINLTDLIYKINNNNKFNLDKKSICYLDSLFLRYNFEEEKEFHYKLNLFKDSYFKDLKIDTSWEDIEISLNNFEKIDYFLFFFKNILLWDYSNKNTDDLVNLFNDYVIISNFYYNYSDDKIKRTWIFNNSQILNKLQKLISEKYFLKQRDEKNLLSLKQESEINKENVRNLEKSIDLIIKFFNDYKSILEPNKNNKDKFIISLYSKLDKNFEEYFFAILKNNEYVVKYDKTTSKLLETKTISEKIEESNQDKLSKEKINSYLKSFYWLYLNKSTAKIMWYNYCVNPEIYNEEVFWDEWEDYCYKVENIWIDNKNLSFILYPFEKNKIDYIYLDNQSITQSYKLDEIEKSWKEKNLAISEDSEDKNKFNFAYFLKNTFGTKDILENNTNNTNNEIEEKIEETTVVKVFKRNKLLWENWDFNILEWFLDISYNSLIVKQENNNYDIWVDSAPFKLITNNNKVFNWSLSSNYDFSNKHSFINPSIKLIDLKNKSDLLIWNKIDLIWDFDIKKLKTDIALALEHYEDVDFLVKSISRQLKNHIIEITYLKGSNTFEFEVLYKNNYVFIELNNWHITKARYKKESLIETKLNLKDINLIFNKILWVKSE